MKMEIDPEPGHPEQEPDPGARAPSCPGRARPRPSTWYFRILEGGRQEARLPHRRAGARADAGAAERRPLRRSRQGHGDLQRHAAASTNRWDTKFEGVIPNLKRRYKETDSDYMRQEFERYMAAVPCPPARAPASSRSRSPSRSASKNITETTRHEHHRGAAVVRAPGRRRRRRSASASRRSPTRS